MKETDLDLLNGVFRLPTFLKRIAVQSGDATLSAEFPINTSNALFMKRMLSIWIRRDYWHAHSALTQTATEKIARWARDRRQPDLPIGI